MATTKIYCCTSSSSPRAFVGRHRRITALFFEKTTTTTTTTTQRNNATRRRRRQQELQTTLLAAAAKKDDNESSYKQQQEWPEPNLWAESHPRYLVSDWDDDDNKEWGEELCAELDDEEDKVEKLFSSAAASVSRKQERKEELAAREGQGNDRQRTQIEASRVSSSSSSSSSSSLSYSTSTTKSAIRAPKRPNSEDLSNKMSREDFWNEIRKEAEVEAAKEPMLSSFYFTSILSHDCLEKSLSFALANRLCTKTLLSTQLIEIFNEVLLAKDSEQLRNNIRRDLVAVLSRDPACNSYVQALLLFKGFHAIQAHRIQHYLWKKGQKTYASMLQSRISEALGVDVHPAAKFGGGILMDHATGCVVGETATIGDDVSILHGVTLGGTGKEVGDRHPKIQDNVLIGARSTILGNITVESGAMIAAGSLVLKPVPANGMVAGNPARVVGRTKDRRPALVMRTKIETREDSKEFCEIFAKAVVEKDKSLMAITKTTRFGPNLSFSSSLEDEPGKGSSSVVIDKASSPLSSEELVKQLDEKRRRRLRGK
jgi:serine O-acetyltransferase|tara:strand:- start:1413 stop:3038 length:1626 start_codon:yes stop_codon:yes gene_type:complete